MADKRTDRTIEETLQQSLDTIQTNLNQIKSPAPQIIGGGSIVSFLSDSGNPYDWTGNLTRVGASPNFGRAVFLISATAATMATLYANLNQQLFVGTPTTWYRPIDYMNDEIAGNIGFITGYLDTPAATTNSNVKS